MGGADRYDQLRNIKSSPPKERVGQKVEAFRVGGSKLGPDRYGQFKDLKSHPSEKNGRQQEEREEMDSEVKLFLERAPNLPKCEMLKWSAYQGVKLITAKQKDPFLARTGGLRGDI